MPHPHHAPDGDRSRPVPARIADRSVDVSIVLPGISSPAHLHRLVRSIADTLRGRVCEFIVPPGASENGLPRAIASLRESGLNVRASGAAAEGDEVVAALREAAGEVLVCIDRELEQQMHQLSSMVETIQQDRAEVVVGTRYAQPGRGRPRVSVTRGLKRRAASLLASPFWRLRDPMTRCFASTRAVVERAPVLGSGGQPSLELIVMAGCSRVVEVPLNYARASPEGLDWRRTAGYVRQFKRLADYKFGGWSQLGQFCMVGVTGLAVDLVAYASLLEVGLALPIARALSICVAMSWTFTLNRRLSFSSQRFGRSILDQYLRYCLSNALGASISWSVAVCLSLFTAFFGRHVLLAAMIGVALGAISNFALARYWVFTRADRARGPTRFERG